MRKLSLEPVTLLLMSSRELAPGLVQNESELVAIWFLEWLHDYRQANPGLLPSPEDCVVHSGNEELRPMVEKHLDAALGMLEDRGLLRVTRTMGPVYSSASLALTSSGSQDVLGRRERRNDVGARRRACREALLRWIYQQDAEGTPAPNISGMPRSTYGYFTGTPFEQRDLDEASRYLREHGLIRGAGSWGGGIMRPHITAEGKQVIEQYSGSVVDYLNRNQNGGVVNQTNFYGSVSGQVAWGNRDVQQHMQQGMDVDALGVLLQALRDIAPILAIQDDDASELATLADQAATEAGKDEPDKSWIKGILDRMKNLVSKSEKAIGTLAIAAIEHYAGQIAG
jgi:hypothetical protein